jgi:hypothetical protein
VAPEGSPGPGGAQKKSIWLKAIYRVSGSKLYMMIQKFFYIEKEFLYRIS